MRIVGGTARGKTLLAPEGNETRPTSDRAREALFNILSGDIVDSRLLDLFAGSGAVCAEALSRGAGEVVAVDCSPQACQIITRNLEIKGVSGQKTVIKADWQQALDRIYGRFDYVFLDPPYRMKEVYSQAVSALADRSLIDDDTLIIMESDGDIPLPAGLRVVDERKYGKARFSFVKTGEEN